MDGMVNGVFVCDQVTKSVMPRLFVDYFGEYVYHVIGVIETVKGCGLPLCLPLCLPLSRPPSFPSFIPPSLMSHSV